MKKITLLAASALLLLTACGQVENRPAEVVPPPATVVQEELQQPQVTPEPTSTSKEPDTVSGVVQEQPQEGNAPQAETVPQATQTHEPVAEPAPTEDIPSETVHAKTGYVEPEPTPEPTALANRQAAIDAANAMRSRSTAWSLMEAWRWTTAHTVFQPQYRWTPRRRHWRPRHGTWWTSRSARS